MKRECSKNEMRPISKTTTINSYADEAMRVGEHYLMVNGTVLVFSTYIKDGCVYVTDTTDTSKIYAIYSLDYYRALCKQDD